MVEVYIPEKGIAGRLDLARRQADEDDLPDDLLLLRELEDHESRAISHLERSNRELAEALEADDDPDFREAIAENVQVLRQKRERVAKVLAKIREIAPNSTAAESPSYAGAAVAPAIGAAPLAGRVLGSSTSP
ncbi:unnamed protein product [Prorocentrum cordatum]|uniref:Uncharacterized protein n=1 Tax=Prorocentrum cordatum TaxID=2364126 RepID=A0ABN9VB50_9DINO|nr:unnamed protein product [Polarella glacialis]